MTSSATGTDQTTGRQSARPVCTIQAPSAPSTPKFRKTARSPKARYLSDNGGSE